MQNSRNIAVGFSLLLTEMVILSCCLYMLVSFGLLETVQVSSYLWLGLIAVSYLVNILLAKKKVAMSLFAIWNVIWMVISFAVTWMSFSCDPDYLLLRILVAAVLVAIETHSCSISLEPPKVEQCLLFIDALAIVFILFLAGSRYQTPGNITGLTMLGFVNLIYLVIVMILLRTSNGARRVIEGNATISRVKMFGLLIGLVGICAFVCVALFGAMRQTAFGLRELLLNILWGIKGLLRLFERFLAWLFRILGIKVGDITVGKLLGYGKNLPPVWEGFRNTIMVMVLCIVAVIIIVIVVTTYQHKQGKKVVKTKSVIVFRERCRHVRIPFLRRWLDKISLYLLMLEKRNTPEGLLVLAKKRAKKIGVIMEPEDSWHGFLLKLAPYGDEASLREFAEYIKRYFYREVPMEFTREQYLKYRKSIQGVKREEKAEKEEQKFKRDVSLRFHV